VGPLGVLLAGKSALDFKHDERGIFPGVPEPTTWAMMLAGFVGLGYAACGYGGSPPLPEARVRAERTRRGALGPGTLVGGRLVAQANKRKGRPAGCREKAPRRGLTDAGPARRTAKGVAQRTGCGTMTPSNRHGQWHAMKQKRGPKAALPATSMNAEMDRLTRLVH
jgi:hypothetical protein